MNKEIWKDIPDFPGYQASNIGRIKSTSRTIYANNGKRSYSYTIPEKIMRLTVRKQYLCVTLCLHGKHINTIVHRLVAKSFLPNPYDYPEINHKDENKLNNCVDNLEWCSRQYNKNYGTGNKRSADNRSIKIIQYSNNFYKEWNSMNAAARYYNIAAASIKSACDRGHKCCKYYWKYSE